MKKKLEPIKLRVIKGKEAWAYFNENSIDIYVQDKSGIVVSARITEHQITKNL